MPIPPPVASVFDNRQSLMLPSGACGDVDAGSTSKCGVGTMVSLAGVPLDLLKLRISKL